MSSDSPTPGPAPSVICSKGAIIQVFDGFRSELDDHNDRRERLIKASRDITSLSKKFIFLLHRLTTDDGSNPDMLRSRSAQNLSEIQHLFAAQKQDLDGDRFWRYQRCVSPGIQEYIEALSFMHYLIHGTLISWQQVQDSLSDETGSPYFPVPIEDYLLGICDLTGELMRFGISALPRKGGRSVAQRVCTFIRQCKTDFESFVHHSRDLSKKQATTIQSLHKMEDVVYAVAIQCYEYNLPNDMLDDIISRTLSIQRGGDHGDSRSRSGEELE